MAAATDRNVAARDAITDAVLTAQLEPLWFTREVLRNVDTAGAPLNDPWQDELLEAFQDLWRAEQGLPTRVNHELKRRFTIRSGHGPGKTILLAQIAHYAGFTRRTQIICIAPKEKQILTRLFPRFRSLYISAIAEYQRLISIDATKITWCQDPNWVMMPEVARDPTALAGYHPNGPDDWLIIIVDEASGVREDFWPVILGMLSRPHTALFMIGNPTSTRNEFYRSHTDSKAAALYYRRHVRLEESRYQDKKWAEELRGTYGADSPVYKVRVLGEFSPDSENQLVALAWLDSAREREIVVDGSVPRLRVSIDVADGGANETVITVSRIYDTQVRFMKQHRFSFAAAESPIEAAQAAVRIFTEWGGDKQQDSFVVDALGVGAGTAGYLIKQEYPVIAYRGGEQADDPLQWRNRRVQSYIVMRNGLRDGWISFDEEFAATPHDWDAFCAQLCAIQLRHGAGKVDDIETKADMLKRGVVSPDMADSAVIALSTQVPRFGGAGQKLSGALFGERVAQSDVVVVEDGVLQLMESAGENW